jgi:BlaI family penicillinase repressor
MRRRTRSSFRITQAEWDVMEVVWDRAPVPASTIVEALEAKRRWTLTTVRTLLRRLVDKGALHQAPDGKRFLYSARVSRADCVRQESDSFLDRVLGRAPAATLLHLVRRADLTQDDIEQLRRILNEKEKS